ncbi:MAG TPA: hypothetical protein VEL74_08635 [Thermoanaerobaculia bacterium]|nr:hypothetical protein [Thermoanaerobaculia bacterium]
MKTARWGALTACLLIVTVAGPAVAQKVDERNDWSSVPLEGRLEPVDTGSERAVAGMFSWEEVPLGYSGEISEDGGRATALVTDAEGRVLAEAVIDEKGSTVILAGVKITSEEEISDQESARVAEFVDTKEAAAIRALATHLAGLTPAEKRDKLLGITAVALTLGEGRGVPEVLLKAFGDCFGCCGPGCWGCYLAGNCYTGACAVHDGCVERLGHRHKTCLKLLAVAVASYILQC